MAIALGVFTSNAQTSATPMLSSSGLALDTATNTTATYVALKVTGNYSFISVQYVATKISGTVAGTAVLQVSNDGTTYTTLEAGNVVETANSYTNTDVASQSKVWTVKEPTYLYYRVLVTGSGTMAASYKANLLGKKIN